MEASIESWAGADVSVAEIEAELARLREPPSGADRLPRQRTSVMTHLAWVPLSWLEAAERTLAGMAARHPSRTIILVPVPDDPAGGIDAELSVPTFAIGDREICGEVIELRLRGDRVEVPGSIVVPLAIADLPVSLRWRGLPDFGGAPWAQLVDLADRLVVDSSEWDELRYAELVPAFARTVVSDIAWARSYPSRVALAGRWPAIRDQQIAVAGPRAEAALLAGWLSARLGRDLPAREDGARLQAWLDGEPVVPERSPERSPSDLLSAELDRSTRDPIYEEAVRRLVNVSAVG